MVDAEQTLARARAVDARFGDGSAREALRILHLFVGFPRVVAAFNAIDPRVDAGLPSEPATQSASELGEQTFREFYDADGDRVLAHLQQLDATFCSYIVQHAYGRVLSRPRLSIAQKERLALICLAESRCWKQWRSHAKIARRVGLSTQTLLSDLEHASPWMTVDLRQQAVHLLGAQPE